MEILSSDKKIGLFKLKISSSDDLWHLSHILEPGDLITKTDLRTKTIKSGQDIKKADKEKVLLTIEAEKIKFDKDLKITGKIVEGPDKISFGYHTFRLEPGEVFSVRKTWKKYHLDRLYKAKEKKPLLLICVLDRDQADVAGLTESGIEYFATIYPESNEDRNPYYKEITKFLEGKTEYERIVIAGPGFEKENLYEYIKHESGLNGIFLEQASNTGPSGVEEVLKRTENRILTETRISKESKYVDEFLKRIKTDGLVIYGEKQVREAVEVGAVQTLLVSIEKVRSLEDLMELTEKMKGEVIIINSDHSMGEQFLKIGGVGAMLRYKI